jgi:hypothetical protein
MQALRRELAEIIEHFNAYFAKPNHSAEEQVRHEQLRERLSQIWAELQDILERTAA